MYLQLHVEFRSRQHPLLLRDSVRQTLNPHPALPYLQDLLAIPLQCLRSR